MSKLLWRALVPAALLLLAALFALQQYEGAPLHRAEGTPQAAPPLDLARLEGGRWTLAGARGHPVLLNFWATWCPPCRAELPVLQRLSRERPGCLEVVGIAEDSGAAAAVQAFARERGVSYPLMLDDGQAGAAYGVVTLPHSALVDAQGRLVGVFRGEVTRWGVRAALEELGPLADCPR